MAAPLFSCLVVAFSLFIAFWRKTTMMFGLISLNVYVTSSQLLRTSICEEKFMIDLLHNYIQFEARDAILCTARNLHHTHYVEMKNTKIFLALLRAMHALSFRLTPFLGERCSWKCFKRNDVIVKIFKGSTFQSFLK